MFLEIAEQHAQDSDFQVVFNHTHRVIWSIFNSSINVNFSVRQMVSVSKIMIAIFINVKTMQRS